MQILLFVKINFSQKRGKSVNLKYEKGVTFSNFIKSKNGI
jgi:hypothetical protein